ncbi:MAG: transglycosylase SLT domain-containing protein [Candidatus Woesearchaeota archaeon]
MEQLDNSGKERKSKFLRTLISSVVIGASAIGGYFLVDYFVTKNKNEVNLLVDPVVIEKKIDEENKNNEVKIEDNLEDIVHEIQLDEKEYSFKDRYYEIFKDYNNQELKEIYKNVEQIKKLGISNKKLDLLVQYLPEISDASKKYGVPIYVLGGILLYVGDGTLKAYDKKTDCAGIYQIQRNTAKDLGLLINESVDYRFFPEFAINAAAKHLKWLNEVFGRWDLAILAYNQGERRVKQLMDELIAINYKDIRSINEIKYYDLKNNKLLLKKYEGFQKYGKNYLESILAMWELFLGNKDKLKSIKNRYYFYETTSSGFSLEEFSIIFQVPFEQLIAENPHIRKIDNISTGTIIRVPKEKYTINPMDYIK